KVSDPNNKKFCFQNANWLLALWPWVWQNGGEVLTPDGTKLAIGSPAVVEAFSFLQDLQVNKKYFSPAGQALFGADVGFDSGNAMMIMRGNWNKDRSRDWKF